MAIPTLPMLHRSAIPDDVMTVKKNIDLIYRYLCDVLPMFEEAVISAIADVPDSIPPDSVGTVQIINNNVFYEDIQVVTESRVLGRGQGAGDGDTQELTLGAGLTLVGTELSSTGGYDDEMAQDAVGSILLSTTTITMMYDDVTPTISSIVNDGSITYAKIQDTSSPSVIIGRGSGSGAGDVQELTAGTGLTISGTTLINTITQYTDENAQDAVGTILVDSGTVDFTYSDAVPSITASVITGSITNSVVADMAAWTFKIRNASTTGDPSDAALADVTTEASPASGDFLIGFLATGEIRKYDVGTLPSGGGAPTNAQYLTLATDAMLTDERVFTPSTNVVVVDGGAGSTYTVSVGTTTFALTGDITPPAIAADQDDYNPTGLSTASVLRLATSTGASQQVRGLVGGSDGRMVCIHNVGPGNFVLPDEAGTSTAGNRFALFAASTIFPDCCAVLQYDGTASRWRLLVEPRVIGLTDGDKGDITVSASGATWTIDNDAVTYAKIQNVAGLSLLGRGTAGAGDVTEIALIAAGGLEFGTTTGLWIQDNGVTNAKLANRAGTSRVVGSSSATSDPVDLTLAAGLQISGTVLGLNPDSGWSTSGTGTDKALSAGDTLAATQDVLGTLITTLIAKGLLAA